MKSKFTKIMSTVLTVIMLLGIMAVPAAAKEREAWPTTGTVVIKMKGRQGESFKTFDTQWQADVHEITIYATPDNFPIEVSVATPDPCSYYSPREYTLNSYGVHRVRSYNGAFTFSRYSYATIHVVARSENGSASYNSTSASVKQPTQEEIINGKLNLLLKKLDNLGFCYVTYTPYSKELKAFLTGEWDGSMRMDNLEDAYGGQIAMRKVVNRFYYWNSTNLYTGKCTRSEASVDYDGYKEIIPGRVNNQHYSLAVSRVNGEIEKWSLFDKQDAWKITQVAGGKETIKDIYPLANDDSGKNDTAVLVYTTDADGNQHMYSLLLGGEVIRMT